RDELLDGEIFYTLREAQIIIESWRRHYNTVRPHASIGYRAPAPEVFVPALAAWPAAQSRPAPPAMLPLALRPPLNYHSTRTTSWGPVRVAYFCSIVLYINFSPTNIVPHGLGLLVGFLAHDNLFLDTRFLAHDRLFLPSLYVDGALVEGISGCSTDRTVNGPAFDCHPLLTQRYTLLL